MMNKHRRNDPCPCGSGKKYKHCCLNKINSFSEQIISENINESFSQYEEFVETWDSPESPPTMQESKGTPNRATEIIKSLQNDLNKKQFNSKDELNEYINNHQIISGNNPIDDFLGLSSKQMHTILYSPFKENKEIVELVADIEEKDIENIPILKQMIYFLNELKIRQPLKATKLGNLPGKFVQDLHAYCYNSNYEIDINVKKEEDNPILLAHRNILMMAGFIKRSKNQYSLTNKNRILEKKNWNVLFLDIFNTYCFNFNWGFLDINDDLPIIQAALIFGLYILKKKANTYSEGKELGEIFLNAFPDLVSEVTMPYEEPEDNVIRCFALRFLRRFCSFFGLVSVKKEGKNIIDMKYFYKTTHLFRRLFEWKV